MAVCVSQEKGGLIKTVIRVEDEEILRSSRLREEVILKKMKNKEDKEVIDFIYKNMTSEKGSTVITDGWRGYSGMEKIGYKHKISDRKFNEVDEKLLPNVHLVISLLKRWILGTLQGSVSGQHMAYYLGEYTFRFNRRTSASRGKLFYRLIEQALKIEPVIYDNIINRKIA